MTVWHSGLALITLLAMPTQVFFLVHRVRRSGADDPRRPGQSRGGSGNARPSRAGRWLLARYVKFLDGAVRDRGHSAWVFASPSLGNSILGQAEFEFFDGELVRLFSECKPEARGMTVLNSTEASGAAYISG
jgi:hypothetical protein